MPMINRQQLCVELGTSESTIRRLELFGLPYTPVGIRAKRYDLDECKQWLREHQPCRSGQTSKAAATSASWPGAKEFTESCRRVQLRVLPSS